MGRLPWSVFRHGWADPAEGNFNAWQSGKLWAVFEAVSQDQRYNQVGKIKQLITGQTVRIEKQVHERLGRPAT